MGLGVNKDEARAMQWYLKAAQGSQSLADRCRCKTKFRDISRQRLTKGILILIIMHFLYSKPKQFIDG